MVSAHSEGQAKAAKERTQAMKSELDFKKEVWATNQKANANKSKLRHWQIESQLHQKQKRFKFEKDQKMIEILKEQKLDAREDLREAKLDNDKKAITDAEANLKNIKNQIIRLVNSMLANDDDDQEPKASDLFEIVQVVSADDLSGEKTGEKSKKMPAEVMSTVAETDSGASTKGAREEEGKRRESGAIIHGNDLCR